MPLTPTEPTGFDLLRVKTVVHETADAHSVVFEVPEALRDRYRYFPGQFLTVRVTVDGADCMRCYSLSSSPSTDVDPKITVKRVAHGRVSNWLFDHLQAGDDVRVMPPKGVFRLREGVGPVVLFAAGSGITPVLSILKQVLTTTERRATLVYANRDVRSVIFRDELERLRTTHGDRLRLIHRLDDRDGPLGREAVAAFAGGPGVDHYLCGPAPFMRIVREGLIAAGVAEDAIVSESFDGADERPAAVAPQDGGGVAAAVTVRVHGQDHTIVVPAAETIHAAATRQGLNLPFSCKAGYCGLCIARVEAGEVRLADNLGGISDAQIAEGLTLACQALVVSAEATLVFE